MLQFLAFIQVQFHLLDEMRLENLNSPFFLTLYQSLHNEPDQNGDYEVHDGLLLYKGKLLLDHNSPLVQQVLHKCHTTLIGGHGGIQKTTAKVCASFTWEGLKHDVKKFVQECVICQQMKPLNRKPARLLQPLPILVHVSMDFVSCLPNSKGNTTVLVVVDRLFKQAHFGALPKSYSTARLAYLFSQIVYKLHGIPRSIVSYRDPIFLSTFWQELFQISGTRLLRSTAYHPQTDG